MNMSALKFDTISLYGYLDEHTHIALDFDDCLLDGSYSRLLTDYIITHSDKHFSIITNRPGRCKRETTSVAYGLLLRRNISHDFKYAHIILSPDSDLCGDSVDPLFKGKAAAAIGATLLVDDDASHRDGCIAHDVAFLHLPYDETGTYIKTGLF